MQSKETVYKFFNEYYCFCLVSSPSKYFVLVERKTGTSYTITPPRRFPQRVQWQICHVENLAHGTIRKWATP